MVPAVAARCALRCGLRSACAGGPPRHLGAVSVRLGGRQAAGCDRCPARQVWTHAHGAREQAGRAGQGARVPHLEGLRDTLSRRVPGYGPLCQRGLCSCSITVATAVTATASTVATVATTAAALGARHLDAGLRVSHVPRRSRVGQSGFGNASCERRWQQGRVLLGRDVLLRGVRGRQRLSHLDVSRAAVARRASVASKRGAHSTSVAAELTRSVCCTTGLTSRRATRPRSPRA